jgi:acetyl-CoA synthetase
VPSRQVLGSNRTGAHGAPSPVKRFDTAKHKGDSANQLIHVDDRHQKLDDAGRVCEPGEVGDVAAHRVDPHGDADPVFFLGYWNNPDATAAKFDSDGWCRTGDLAYADDDGYLWYQGRADDMFKSSGYRIGPTEIENCLLQNEAVANAAVIPIPDADRGNVIKAFVVLAAGFAATDELAATLRQHVRERLAPYETPREIEFIDALPMTTTGKVRRRVLREHEAKRRATS